jgi:ribonuclease HI
MEDFDTKLGVIEITLDVMIEKGDTVQKHGLKTVAGVSDSHIAIQRTAHLEPGPGKQLARQINRRVQSLCAHGIATEIHWVLGNSGTPGTEEADRHVNLVQDASGSTLIKRPYTWVLNSAT